MSQNGVPYLLGEERNDGVQKLAQPLGVFAGEWLAVAYFLVNGIDKNHHLRNRRVDFECHVVLADLFNRLIINLVKRGIGLILYCAALEVQPVNSVDKFFNALNVGGVPRLGVGYRPHEHFVHS